MDYSFLIEYLRQKQHLTDLEKDILDTWNELQKNPFDRSAAQKQVLQNNAKYPEIFAAIAALPTTVTRPIEPVRAWSRNCCHKHLACQGIRIRQKEANIKGEKRWVIT